MCTSSKIYKIYYYFFLLFIFNLIINGASLYARDHKRQRPIDLAPNPNIKVLLRSIMNRFQAEKRKLLFLPEYHNFLKIQKIKKREQLIKIDLSVSNMVMLSLAQMEKFKYEVHLDNYLSYVLRMDERPAMEYILSRGVSVLASDNFGRNALHYAVELHHLPAIAYMCEGNWKPYSVKDLEKIKKICPWVADTWRAIDQCTYVDSLLPFHVAAMNGSVPILKYLLHIVELRMKCIKYQQKSYFTKEEMLEYKTKNGSIVFFRISSQIFAF